jgi:quinol monooxygenase YgiN
MDKVLVTVPHTVVAHIRAQSTSVAYVRAQLLTMVMPSRAEIGCLNYDLHQSLDDPTLFVIHENWIDRAALEAHFQTAHFRALMETLTDTLAEPMLIIHLARVLAAHEKVAERMRPVP